MELFGFKFVLLLFFGLLIEVIQYFIPNREFSFYDLVANLVGIAFGYILYKLIRPSKYRKNYF
jgi:VanZ family protein